MHYRHPEHYEVGREKIREHAIAVKNDDAFYHDEAAAAELGHDSLPAPLTFICIFGYQAQWAFFEWANIGIQDAQIVQVDQELKFLKPIKAGDKLYCDVLRALRSQGARHRHHRDQEHHHRRQG